ncbi:MAG: ArsA family ATPase [Acidobacteria bacterium]|jgi:arsenite-transporting ATPase|nr:ArsA family ATPase [Acidobacteriota bacterium]
MRTLLDRSVLFFGGKGGVGKTTCAAATALEAARLGRRVLLVSVDPAHSVADVFDTPIGEAPTRVAANLTARELDPAIEAERYLGAVREQVAQLFSATVVKQAFRQFELAAQAPGLEDVAVFDRVMQLVLEPVAGFDLLVVDTAPTGHALRMLAMPDALVEWLDALARRRGDIVSENDRTPGSRDADPVVASLRQRSARVQAFQRRLTDAAATGFALVLTPERLPIEETKRAADTLDRLGVGVPAVIVNRVLPVTAEGDYHAARVRQQQVYLGEIAARFASYPLTTVTQLESDVHGIPALERVRAQLFGTA